MATELEIQRMGTRVLMLQGAKCVLSSKMNIQNQVIMPLNLELLTIM